MRDRDLQRQESPVRVPDEMHRLIDQGLQERKVLPKVKRFAIGPRVRVTKKVGRNDTELGRKHLREPPPLPRGEPTAVNEKCLHGTPASH